MKSSVRKKQLSAKETARQSFFKWGPTIFRGIHTFAKAAFARGGYRLEIRRRGELKLGLWRKNFRKVKSPSRRLVVLPGLGDSPLSWLTVLAPLSPIIRSQFDEIILIDFPGFHGFLSQEKAFASMDLMQSALFDALDTLRPQAILGHSLGGWMTAAYAVQCAERKRPLVGKTRYMGPQKLILICPSGILPDAEKVSWKARFQNAFDGDYVTFLQRMFGKMPKWYRFAGESLATFFQKPEILQFVESIREDHMVGGQLAQTTAKPFLIWGDLDDINPYSWFDLWYHELGEARTEAIMLPKVGHMPHIESPARLIGVLAQVFLAKHELPRNPLLKRLTEGFWIAR